MILINAHLCLCDQVLDMGAVSHVIVSLEGMTITPEDLHLLQVTPMCVTNDRKARNFKAIRSHQSSKLKFVFPWNKWEYKLV